MKNTQTPPPRWIRYGIPGIVAGFLVVLTFTFVSAQSFTNPTCNPLEDLNCNKSSPLFLDPEDNSATQIVQSPVSIGDSTTPRALELYGNANLYGSATITTPSPIGGKAIDVQSSGNNAIVGLTSHADSAGLYGVGAPSLTGPTYGVYATSTSTNSNSYPLYVLAGSNGKAAKLQGNTLLYSSNGLNSATLSVDNTTGSLNIVPSVVGAGITVNGSSVGASGLKTKYLYTDLALGVTATFSKEQIFGVNDTLYRVESIQAMYASKATNQRLWLPVPIDTVTPKLMYEECSATGILGQLRVVNPSSASQGISLRVIVSYEEQNITLTACSGESTPPTIAWQTPPTAGTAGTSMNVVVNAADNTTPPGVSKVEFYDNGVLVGTDATASPAPSTHSLSIVRSAGSHSYTARAYDSSGNTTTTAAVVVVHTDVCNNACNPVTQFCCTTTAICMANGQICGGGGGGGLEL